MTRLTYSEFLETVAENFLSFFPETWKNRKINIQAVHKNNRTYDGLSLLVPEKDHQMVPTVYVQDMYAEYFKEYENFPDPLKAILSTYADRYMTAYRSQPKTSASQITVEMIAAAPILPQLVMREGNEDFLQDKVWTPFLDLAVIYRAVLDVNENGFASFVITNQFLEATGMTREQIEGRAKTDRPLGDPVIQSMEDSMRGMLEQLPDELRPEPDEFDAMFMVCPEMIVLTNRLNKYGAAEMLNTELFRQMAEERECDLLIIPSSVHELIIVSADDFDDPDYAMDMVRSVNNSGELSPEEILSYSVYRYYKDRDMIDRV